MLLKLVACFGIFSAVYGDTAVINAAVDKLLDATRAEIKRSGQDVMRIEDLKHPFSTRWHFVKMNWFLHCTDGWVNSISTLKRTGDIVLSSQGDEISLELDMGLSGVEVYFEQCQVTLRHFLRHTTKVWSKVDRNAFKAKVTLRVNDETDECKATLDRMQLTQLQGVKVRTGGGLFHGAMDQIIRIFINHINGRFARIMSNHLVQIIRDYALMDKVCDVIQNLNETTSNF